MMDELSWGLYYARLDMAAAQYRLENTRSYNQPTSQMLDAADHGDWVTVSKLLDSDEIEINAQDHHGHTLLHHASYDNKLDVIERALAAGADCNLINMNKRTPLAVATTSSNIQIAELLVSAGADVNVQVDSFDFRTRAGSRPVLHEAVDSCLFNLFDQLLAAGAAVNTRSEDGVGATALMMAASSGTADMVNPLIEAGADVSIADESGRTALHYATDDDADYEVYKALLSAGADVNARAKTGETVLHDAAEHRIDELVALLLSAGALVNVTNEHGSTPLSLASKQRPPFSVESTATLLASAGAKLHTGITLRCPRSRAMDKDMLACIQAAHLKWIKAVAWDVTIHFSTAEDASYACHQEPLPMVQLAVLEITQPGLNINTILCKWSYILATRTVFRLTGHDNPPSWWRRQCRSSCRCMYH
eukprot:m.27560 g.27560  ORF g.27560 m.27560 type:complete len:421 (-) comp11758_c0_seq2:376-1638(-)